MLDSMKILLVIWSNYGKYATEAGIKSCWIKAGVIPPAWNQDIKNYVGSNSISEKEKSISHNFCEFLCTLINNIQMKTTSTRLDTSTIAVCFGDSFIDDPDATDLEESAWVDMASN